MIWFTSDLHGYHKNIAGEKVSAWKSGYRNFNNEFEMTDTIVKTINKYVKHNDTLYSLGDWSFGSPYNIKRLRDQINCQTIHHILGNHCTHIKKNKFVETNSCGFYPQDCFTSVQDVLTIKDEISGCSIFMSHYSHQVWYGSHKGIIHLFGHSHASLEGIGKSMDVGVDNAYKLFGEYRPFSIEEIVKLMNRRKIDFVDHHNKTQIYESI